jgi:DNA-binding transcriptional ArsR family regulator
MYSATMPAQPALPEICVAALMRHARPDMFKALCDPVRISIVATLAARRSPATVSQIAECCGIDFSGVSRHLKILHDVGILSATKQGREKLYAVEIEHLADSLRSYANALEMCASPLTRN